MSWFSKQIVAAPEPELPPVDRLEEARLAMVSAKADLDLLDRAMLTFKTRHHVLTDKFGRLLSIQSATLTGRAKIEAEWRTLLARRDVVMTRWHAALFLWSDLKLLKEKQNAK